MAAGVRDIAALPDPVGEELEERTLYNGLELTKVRVPLGVVAVVYEARPNVTVDAAALAIKSGNAIVLRGSLDGAALERARWPRSSRAARARPPACPRARSSLLPAATARDLPELIHPGRARRPGDPARRRGPEEGR